MVINTSVDVKNKILVVSSVPHSRPLIQQIIGKEDLTFRPLYSDEVHSIDWTIDTKYYTADVEFWHLDQHQYPPAQLPIDVEQLGGLVEALILVFDSNKYETFEKLHPWTHFVEEYAPSVLLCVGIGKSDNKRVFNEWCVDNGLEFVELAHPTTTPSPSAPPTPSPAEASTPAAEGEDEEEEEDRFTRVTEGRERIIEALYSTMWSNMTPKERRTESLEDQFSSMLSLRGAGNPSFDPLNFDEDLRLARGEFGADADADADADTEFGEFASARAGEYAQTGEFERAAGAGAGEIAANLRALQAFLRETPARESGEPEEVEGGVPAFLGGAETTENSVEQFENALSGLRKLRENAQQLPDAQRKALAAQVISMLFPEEEWD